MRALFLNPPSESGAIYMKEIGRCGRKSVAGELWPQTGLAYLAAVAEQRGWGAQIEDGMASGRDVEGLCALGRAFRPDLIVASTTTPTFNNDARVTARLKKECGALLALTGQHVTALPERSLASSRADLILIGEAEVTLGELLAHLSQHLVDADWRAGLEAIAGLAFRRHGDMLVTAPRQPVADLDALPPPASRLLPHQSYRLPFFGDRPFLTVIPTRGCPWPCTFCRAGGVWGRRIRTRPPASVMGEIRRIVADLGVRHFVFMTDSLTLNKHWAKEFFNAIIDSDLPIEWICNSRVDVVDPEMLALMKRANCQMISYGIESGVQEILDRSLKGITLDQARQAIAWTREAGISSLAYFILGLPGETPETIEETIRFSLELEPDYVNFHVATPFPGTALYDEALKNNWLTSTNWDDFEEEGSPVLRTPELSPRQLLVAQRRAMRQFYFRPRRLWRELRAVRSWEQLRTRVRAGWKMARTVILPSRGTK